MSANLEPFPNMFLKSGSRQQPDRMSKKKKKAKLNPVELQAADLSTDSHVLLLTIKTGDCAGQRSMDADQGEGEGWNRSGVRLDASSIGVREKRHKRSLDLCMVTDKRMT